MGVLRQNLLICRRYSAP